MPQYLSPIGNDQFIDANGDPLVGGQIETYLAVSSTPAATYTDNMGSVPQSNPIILNSLGYPTLGAIWLTGGLAYKFILKTASGVTLRTTDNIVGIGDTSVSLSEWVESGFVPTYITGTSFSVPGDQTLILQVGRRLRTTNTSGLVYSTISNSAFAAGITTVTLTNDSTTLDAGLSQVAYALLAADPLSVPNLPGSKITGAFTSSGMTMATARVLGRLTASTGAVEELTATQITTSFVNAATDTAQGKVELATNGEAQGGTDTTRAVTPANLTASQLGRGQTWQNLTGSRSAGSAYQNTSGRPIFIAVRYLQSGSGTTTMFVDSVEVSYGQQATVSGGQTLSAIVPNASFYQVNVVSNTLSYWAELR